MTDTTHDRQFDTTLDVHVRIDDHLTAPTPRQADRHVRQTTRDAI
jgi:hypothetical protein